MGMPILVDVPQHGHQNSYDGGILKPAGVMVYSNVANQLTLANGAFGMLPWDLEYYDTNNFHSITVNTTRFTVPVGYNWISIVGSFMAYPQVGAYLEYNVWLFKGGIQFGPPYIRNHMEYNYPGGFTGIGNTPQLDLVTGIISASAGEYFEIQASNLSGQNIIFDGRYNRMVVNFYR